MGAPDRETLHAALRERYELQSREKSQATRSEADAALHGEVEAFLAQRPNNSSAPETLTKLFCAGRRGGCSWPEALVALALAFEGTPQPRREPADNERATQRMAGSRPTQPLEACSRVPAASLDPATFLEQYVAASRPVVLTGLLDDWAAVQPSSSRRWDLDYLWRKAANSTVKAYISPDGEFEAVRRADEVVGGERVCAGCAADELVLMRPAETEVRLEHFLWLVKGYENPERAAFYLQKHPLSKWRALGLVEDVTPPPHERLAPFLRPLHELLWLATQCTVGPLHYDEQENLHAMVSAPRCPPRRPALVACAAATAPVSARAGAWAQGLRAFPPRRGGWAALRRPEDALETPSVALACRGNAWRPHESRPLPDGGHSRPFLAGAAAPARPRRAPSLHEQSAAAVRSGRGRRALPPVVRAAKGVRAAGVAASVLAARDSVLRLRTLLALDRHPRLPCAGTGGTRSRPCPPAIPPCRVKLARPGQAVALLPRSITSSLPITASSVVSACPLAPCVGTAALAGGCRLRLLKCRVRVACADLRTFAHESLYDFLRSTPDARSATRPDRWRKTSSTSRDASDREEL